MSDKFNLMKKLYVDKNFNSDILVEISKVVEANMVGKRSLLKSK